MWLLVCAALVGSTLANEVQPSSEICSSLIEPPTLTFETPPESTVVVAGSTVTLTCSVYGAPQASISWFLRGVPVDRHPAADLELAIPAALVGSGLVESALRIPCVSPSTAGLYSCVATTACGQTITGHASVKIARGIRGSVCNQTSIQAPWISLSTVQRLEIAGNPVQLMCRARGQPAPSILWQRINDDETLEDIENRHEYMTLSNGDLLVIGDKNTVTESFRCTATNKHGSAYAESTVLYTEN